MKWKAFIGSMEGRRKQITLSSFRRWKVSYMADFLIGADQKIIDQLAKITFRGENGDCN